LLYYEHMLDAFSFDYFGSTITAQSLGNKYAPPIGETLTAHCVPVTEDGKIVAVDVVNRGVDIPGGHIEDGEAAVTAMSRETYEEASITLGESTLIDVWKASSDNELIGLSTKPYLLVYVARVKSVDEFVPNQEVRARLFLAPDEFVLQYFGDKKQAEAMVGRAMAALEI